MPPRSHQVVLARVNKRKRKKENSQVVRLEHTTAYNFWFLNIPAMLQHYSVIHRENSLFDTEKTSGSQFNTQS
jgi:hypothetical protein